MQKKQVQCPSCGQVLNVQNPNNKALIEYNCPKCNAWLQTKFTPQQEPFEAKTFHGSKRPPMNNGATLLSGVDTGSTLLSVFKGELNKNAQLEVNGQPYPLQEGLNIVGRKSDTSKATVQIETDDASMSRQHCKITVSTLPNGTKKVVLSNYLNKNRTLINEQLITMGEKIRLSDGNKITMGCTIVTFKLTSF